LNIINRVLQPLGYGLRGNILYKIGPARRSNPYQGTKTGNLFASWKPQNLSADQNLRYNLTTLRARARDMARNNDYAKRFLRMVKTNVVGHNGIILQSRVVNDAGTPDEGANKALELAFKDWGKKGYCEISGRYSWRDIQGVALKHMAADGEVLIRRIRDYKFNKYGYALQMIEADHLDEKHNAVLGNKNVIKMGIEFASNGRPVAYHLLKIHPGERSGLIGYGMSYGERVRVPASEIIHLFIPERISQNRGVPWMHTALTRMQMAGGYEEAELVAARTAAAKMGFFTNKAGDDYQGDAVGGDGTPIIEAAEPGKFDDLPPGYDFKPWDPQHPTTAYKDFMKTILRGVASGLDVSYNNLANDLEGVNYSSIRQGVLDERDVWRDLQAFLKEHFLNVVYADWLEMVLLLQAVRLPLSKYDKS
jgi:lambda family phage portal protein